jgi:hypothetical protein
MRRCLTKVMLGALMCGGLAVSVVGTRPVMAAPIIPAAPWKVTPVAAIPDWVIPIPNALPGVGFTAVREAVLKLDLNGDGDLFDGGFERVDPSTGASIPFEGTVLDFANYDPTGMPRPLFDFVDLGEPVRGGLFVWAAERPGIDLDGDGATNHTGYFWASGSGTLRFVRAGKPYVPLYSSIVAAMYGHGDGVAIVESEADRKIDLDANGTIDGDHYDVVSLHTGGTATVEHVQTFGQPSLERLHDGSVGGSLFVRADGSMRTFNPNARVAGHIGEAVYRNVMVDYMGRLGPMLLDRPGVAPFEVNGRIVSQDEGAVWWEVSEAALGRDLTGEGTIDPNTLATCRVVADGSKTCTAVAQYRQSPQIASTGPGYLIFYGGSTVPSSATGFQLYLLGPSGLVGTYGGKFIQNLGDGSVAFAESTPPIGADVSGGAAVRIVRGGVVSAPVWSHRMVWQAPQIASLGDGRALITIAEGVPNDVYLPPNPFAEDLNGNGRFGDDVTFLYANGAMTNLRVLADPSFYYVDFARKVTRPNGPIFISVFEGGSGVDLNGDGDTLDAVVHVVDGTTVTNLGLAVPHDGNFGGAYFQVAGPDSVYTRVHEGEQQRDLDGNGAIDYVDFHYFLVSRMPSHGFVTPARLLDTRPGGQIGYIGAKPTAGQTLEVQIAGQGGLPASGVRAVALNVTMTDATSPGFVTVWGDGGRPETSNLNVQTVGQTVPNMVIVPVGADGKVRIYTDHGGHLLADVAAWWGEDSGLTPLAPSRLLDTRSGAKPAPGSVTTLHVAGRGGAPATGPMVAVLNVTLTAATAAGYVTVWGPGDRPATSNLNATRTDHTAANLVIVPVDSNGDVHLYTDNGTYLIADLTGVFTSGVTVIAPNRILDTRNTTKPNPGQTITVPVGVPAGTTVVLNVTATAATGPGFVTVWPDKDRPNASNLNIVTVGQTIPNLVIVPVGADGNIRLYTDAGTHLIIDHLATLS